MISIGNWIVIFGICLLASISISLCVGTILYRLGMRDGFDMGRVTQNQPTMIEIKKLEKEGDPALADYDPYADAMGDEDVIETIKTR